MLSLCTTFVMEIIKFFWKTEDSSPYDENFEKENWAKTVKDHERWQGQILWKNLLLEHLGEVLTKKLAN
jgi:hypothetical protein